MISRLRANSSFIGAIFVLLCSALLLHFTVKADRAGSLIVGANKSNKDSIIHFDVRFPLAGGIAGGITNAIIHPIDTLKTMRQSAVYSGNSPPLSHTSNPVAEVIKTIRSAGFSKLYAGFWPAVFGAIPSSALYFGSYETAKSILNQHMQSRLSRSTINMLAAASGNIASSVIFVPKEAIKQQLQAMSSGTIPMVTTTGTSAAITATTSAASGSSVTALQVAEHMYKTNGWKGFFPSYRATLLRNIPSAVVKFTLYEELKVRINHRFEDPRSRSVGYLLAGAVSNLLSSAVTTPIDVVKTRLATGVIPPGTGIAPAVVQIMKSEGLTGLFAGRGERLLLSALFGGIGFVSFEWSKAALGLRDKQLVAAATTTIATKTS